MEDWDFEEPQINEDDLQDPLLLKELQELSIDKESELVIEPSDETTQESIVEAVVEPESMEPDPIVEADDSMLVSTKDKSILEERLKQYKSAALDCKRNGDRVGAKKYVIIVKQIQEMLLGQAPVVIPLSPQVPESPQKPSPPVTMVASSNEKPVIIETLLKQAEFCNRLSRQYFESGNKEEAKRFAKMKQDLLTDVNTLKTSEYISYYYTNIEYSVEKVEEDLALDELELEIVKGFDLHSHNHPDIETMVSFELGWSVHGSDKNTVGETGVIKGGFPEYNFKMKIPIARSRTFQRCIERKKLIVTVYQLKSSLILFKTKVAIGKLSLKLSDLLENCVIHEILQLTAPDGRTQTLGKLEIKLRLKKPLVKSQYIKKTEKWLVVGIHSSSNVNEKTLEEDKKEELIMQFQDPDNIVSNLVLEKELLMLKDSHSNADISDRQAAYQLRINMLVAQVQMGALDMETYIQQVKQSIEDTKKVALAFKKLGELEWAKKALFRVKIMTQEINEVE